MLRKMWIAALLLGVSAGSVAAANCCPTQCCPEKNQWRLTADYLYFMPSVDDTYFVIDAPETSTFPTGTRKNNDFNFHSGYRVGGAYEFCDCDREVEFYYSHLGFNQSRTVTGGFLWGTVGSADFASQFENYSGTATSDLNYLYQRFDAFYSQQLYDCCGLEFGVKLGLEAAELKLNEEYTFVNGVTTGVYSHKARTWGIGPQFGFAGEYEFYRASDCSCLPGVWSINFLSTGSLLAADTKTSINETTPSSATTVLSVRDEKAWRVIPAFHARVGLGYDLSFSCADVSLEVGYEFSSYLRGLTRVGYADDVADALSYNNYYNYDLQGLYISGSVKF